MPRPADRRTKIELLRAAEAVFAEHGFAAAKVEDITARAGVSKGAFYLHFETKEDCWRQIVEGFLARLAERLEPVPAEPGEGPQSLEEIRQQWHEHDVEIFEFCWQNRGLLRMILEGGGGTPYAYLVDEFAEGARKHSEDWVRHGIASGVYRTDVDPTIVAGLISGAYDRLVRTLIRQPKRPDLVAWSFQTLDLFTRGLHRGERPAKAEAVVDREVRLESGARLAR